MRPAAQHSHVPVVWPLACLAALLLLAGCAREEAEVQRARLEPWFSLGETLAFEARRGCAVGLYEVVARDVKSALPLMGDVVQMHREIARRGAAALIVAGRGADTAMLAMAGHDRGTGMAMRRAGLEARDCMDARSEDVFIRALSRPGAVMAWHAESGTLILMPGDARLLIAVQGAR
ncbi:hypothetical protein [Roseovarius sp. D22-M7]|uniref:hypothetical protein n=1 Tax=Roseovarius sp. D22-M7 TaxID=3127116 RepID=UPI00300FAB3D